MKVNEIQHNDKKHPGSSVDLYWRVHESKTYPGWKYYYNTETKQSAWILSDKQVNINQTNKKTDINKRHCLNETINQSQHDTIQSECSSKNRVNNNEHLKNNNNVSHCCGNQHKTYNPICFLNTIPLNMSSSPTFSNNIWTVPPPNQFIVTPAQGVLVQSQFLNAHNYNNLSETLLNRASRELPFTVNTLVQENLQMLSQVPYEANYHGIKKNKLNNKKCSQNNVDFRKNISANAYLMFSDSNTSNKEDNKSAVCSFKTWDDATPNQSYQCPTNDTRKYLNISKELDLTAIRDLAKSNVNLAQWYIVADTKVIQENFNFLNNIIDSDKRCRIMVPNCVLAELRSIPNDPGVRKLQRIYRFISNEIERGRRWIGENTQEIISILDVCLNLSYKNYHVVYVSSKKECFELTNATQISILTVQEFKNILINRLSLNQSSKIKDLENKKGTVVNNEEGNNAKTLKNLNENYSETEHLYLAKPTVVNMSPKIINNSNSDAQNTEDAQLCSSEMDQANSDVDKLGIVNNTDTLSTFDYKRRLIKLKQNAFNKNRVINLKRSWKIKKNTPDNANTDLVSGKDSILSKQSNVENDISDVKDSNGNVKSVDSTSNSLEYLKAYNSKSGIILNEMKESNVIRDCSSAESITKGTFDSINIKKNRHIYILDLEEPNLKVMFEIRDRNMEDYLIVRCDEWVSRFVQIMEETLSQVLRQEPQFVNEEFPPPWMLQEATHCVIKKFCSSYYVVDAANNLSIVIKRTSNENGKVDMNMEPLQFMKMYSYGVYLVKALMYECINCEDLNNAEELLKKLLYDIENQDTLCPNESYNNPLRESLTVNQRSNLSLDDIRASKSTIKETLDELSLESCTVHSIDRNLNETIKNINGEQNLPLETAFITNLELHRTSLSSSNSTINDTDQEKISEPHTDDTDKNKSPVKSKPKNISNFTECNDHDEDQMLNNRKGECIQSDPIFDCIDECSIDNNEHQNFAKQNTDGVYRYEKGPNENSINIVDDLMNNFRCFVQLIVEEVRKAFIQVHNLCHSLLSSTMHGSSTQSELDKVDQYTKTVRAHFYLLELSKSLQRVLNREMDKPDNTLLELMNKAGVNIPIDTMLTSKYRNIIEKSIEQANEYLSFTNRVISLTKDIIVL